jgi:mannose-6-phosphate isomerase-like protein (cupin superfamily)
MNPPVWSKESLETHREQSGKPDLGFLRASAIRLEGSTLPVGSTKLQRPHVEDRVFVVLEGQAEIHDFLVKTGAAILVPAMKEHRFHSSLFTALSRNCA